MLKLYEKLIYFYSLKFINIVNQIENTNNVTWIKSYEYERSMHFKTIYLQKLDHNLAGCFL